MTKLLSLSLVAIVSFAVVPLVTADSHTYEGVPGDLVTVCDTDGSGLIAGNTGVPSPVDYSGAGGACWIAPTGATSVTVTVSDDFSSNIGFYVSYQDAAQSSIGGFDGPFCGAGTDTLPVGAVY